MFKIKKVYYEYFFLKANFSLRKRFEDVKHSSKKNQSILFDKRLDGLHELLKTSFLKTTKLSKLI